MSDNGFVKVNDEKLDLTFALNCQRGLEDDSLSSLFGMIAGRQYAQANNIAVSDEELQRAVDEFRYLMGLEATEAFNQYLKDRQIGLLPLQIAMENVLLQSKAAAAIPDDEVDAVIAENQLTLEEVELYHIRVDDEDTAQEIKSLLDEDENFLALAWEHSQDEETRKQGGYIGLLGRQDMIGEIEAEVFNAEPGAIIGPMKTEAGYNIFKVERLVKPDREDPKLRDEIKMDLLNEKVATLLDKADVDCSLFE